MKFKQLDNSVEFSVSDGDMIDLRGDIPSNIAKTMTSFAGSLVWGLVISSLLHAVGSFLEDGVERIVREAVEKTETLPQLKSREDFR